MNNFDTITERSLADPNLLELEPTPPEVKRYQRLKLYGAAASIILSLGWLGLLGLVLGPPLGQWLTNVLGPHEALRLLGVALVLGLSLEILSTPIDFWSGYILEHRFGLSNQSLGGWIWKRIKGYLVGGIIGLSMLYGLYAILWLTGDYWWLWATAGFLLVNLVLGQLLPVVILPLFYKVTRLEDVSLLDRIRGLTEGTGLTVEGVYRLHLSEETKKANAALAGLGHTRRVLLGDTLLDQFTPEEIEVVFAHEVGHHVHRHLLKMVGVSVFLSLAGFWLVNLVLNHLAGRLGYAGLTDPAALPLLLFVLSVFGLVLSPAQNALSRFFETQSDTYALQRTGKPATYRSAFIKLAKINKADPDPHPLVAWLFYDHPPIRRRLSLAEN